MGIQGAIIRKHKQLMEADDPESLAYAKLFEEFESAKTKFKVNHLANAARWRYISRNKIIEGTVLQGRNKSGQTATIYDHIRLNVNPVAFVTLIDTNPLAGHNMDYNNRAPNVKHIKKHQRGVPTVDRRGGLHPECEKHRNALCECVKYFIVSHPNLYANAQSAVGSYEKKKCVGVFKAWMFAASLSGDDFNLAL